MGVSLTANVFKTKMQIIVPNPLPSIKVPEKYKARYGEAGKTSGAILLIGQGWAIMWTSIPRIPESGIPTIAIDKRQSSF